MYRFSIIVPVYNAELHINRCLDSILTSIKKSGLMVEVVIVDDGSVDKSNNIISSYLDDHSFITLVSKINEGVSTARNLGLCISSGEYISFVDADDELHEDYLLTVSNFLYKNEVDIVQIGYERVSKNRNYKIIPSEEFAYNSIDKYFRKNTNSHAVWAYVFRKAVINENILSFDKKIKYSEDQDFLVKFFCVINSIGTINKTLYLYHDVESSAVNKPIDEERASSSLIVLNNFFDIDITHANRFHLFLVEGLLYDYFYYSSKVKGFDYKSKYKIFYNSLKLKKNLESEFHFLLSLPLILGPLFIFFLGFKIRLDRKIKSVRFV